MSAFLSYHFNCSRKAAKHAPLRSAALLLLSRSRSAQRSSIFTSILCSNSSAADDEMPARDGLRRVQAVVVSANFMTSKQASAEPEGRCAVSLLSQFLLEPTDARAPRLHDAAVATFKSQGWFLMSRISWAMAAAFVVMAVTALLLISGPWRPRLVERDAAGVPVGGQARPLAPGTPINSARTPALLEGTSKSP